LTSAAGASRNWTPGLLCSTLTLLLTFVLLNYLYFREVMFFMDLPRKLAIMLSPLFAFTLITTLYFFSCFYREQKQTS
jgi:hypothetical protein